MSDFPRYEDTDDPDERDLAEWMEEFAKEEAILDGLPLPVSAQAESDEGDDEPEEPGPKEIVLAQTHMRLAGE